MSRMETKVLLVGHGRAERKTNGSNRTDEQRFDSRAKSSADRAWELRSKHAARN